MKKISGAPGRWLLLLLIGLCAAPALAETSTATIDESQAKQAIPSTGKALLYIYRRQDGGTRAVGVSLNGTEVVKLSPQTFGLWNVNSGRIDIRVEGKVLALDAEAGRIYFVELTHSPAATTLRQLSYAEGRKVTQQARLAGTQVAAPKAPAPAEPAPPARPPVPATSAPAKPPTKPAAPKPAPVKPRPAKKPAVSGQRDNFVLTLKFGSIAMSSDSQEVIGDTLEFDSSASTPFVLEGEGFIDDNVSIGGEIIQYSNTFINQTTSDDGDVSVRVLLANAKYYFGTPDTSWRPYVGAGLGLATTEFGGTLEGNTAGVAYALTGGIQRLWYNISVRGEYKMIHADTEDDNGETIDVSASGIFVGVSFHF